MNYWKKSFLLLCLLVIGMAANAEKLDIATMGTFIAGTTNHSGWNPAGFIDSNTSTYGINWAHYDTFTFRYDFSSAKYVNYFRFYIAVSEPRDALTQIVTTTGTIDKVQDFGSVVGWVQYDVNNFVTQLIFQAPYLNRYTITEVEVYGTTVPEPNGIILVAFAIILSLVFRYKKIVS